MYRLCVIAALGTDQYRQLRERLDIIGVLYGSRRAADRGRAHARLRGAEERRLDQVEVARLAHTREQHGSHHAAPTDDAYLLHAPIMNSRAGARKL